jgi:hypothetical protein
MSFFMTVFGLSSKIVASIAMRFLAPKEVVLDIAMEPSLFVRANLKKLDLKYRFARKDRVVALQHDGWRVAQGRKWLVLTENYVDTRKELILICKDLP